MVKLFVGNLSDSVDSHRLKNLFLQYGFNVQECDVLKNFAFVHVQNEDDATAAIEKLDKQKLEGREIHIERSTSRLRKEPGMSDKCFTCGATDHKTPSCPQEQERRKNKRPGDPDEEVQSKRPVVLPQINLAGGTAPAAPTAAPQCWGYKVGGGSDADPELPCPANPELRTLYDQYLESRTRYFFYRERLGKELSLQPGGAAASAAPNAGAAHLVRIDLTRPAASAVPAAVAAAPLGAVSYSVPQAVHVTAQVPAQSVLISAAPSAPYNSPFRGVTVNAPYGTQTVASAAPVAYSVSHYNTVPQVTQQTLPNVQQIHVQQMGQPQVGISTQIRPQVTQVIPQQQTTLGYAGTQMVNVVGQPGQLHVQGAAITSQPYQLQAPPAQNAGYSALPQQPQRVQLSAPYQQSAPYQAALAPTAQQQNGLSWREMKAEPQY